MERNKQSLSLERLRIYVENIGRSAVEDPDGEYAHLFDKVLKTYPKGQQKVAKTNRKKGGNT